MEKSKGEDVAYRARSKVLGEFLLDIDSELVLPECSEGASEAAQHRVLRARQEMRDEQLDSTEVRGVFVR